MSGGMSSGIIGENAITLNRVRLSVIDDNGLVKSNAHTGFPFERLAGPLAGNANRIFPLPRLRQRSSMSVTGWLRQVTVACPSAEVSGLHGSVPVGH